jgi:DNA processing protein
LGITSQELRDYLALWSVSGIGSMTSRKLIAYAGTAQNVLKFKQAELLKVPGIGPKLIESILAGGHYERADKELEFIDKYKIKVTSIFDDDYPFV